MENYIDLHMHSRFSDDGEYAPADLVKMCSDAGIRIMAIADHNSVQAVPEELETAERLGLKAIPAIEIDCQFQDIPLHVLGYGIHYKEPVFQAIHDNILNQELQNSSEKLRLTNLMGFSLTEEDMRKVSSNGVYTGEMFAEILLNSPAYDDCELLKPYRRGGARSDNPYVNFYWDYYAKNKPCFTAVTLPALSDIIAIIHGTEGLAVLAHPGINLSGHMQAETMILNSGIDGIEAFSSYHSAEECQDYLQKAEIRNLAVTCGSDFHGRTKPSIHLGITGCTIDQSIIEKTLADHHLI